MVGDEPRAAKSQHAFRGIKKGGKGDFFMFVCFLMGRDTLSRMFIYGYIVQLCQWIAILKYFKIMDPCLNYCGLV